MRTFLTFSALAISGTILAQTAGAYGTKPDVIQTVNTSGVSAPPTGAALLQLSLVLLFVVLLFKWALPKAMSKFNKSLRPSFDSKIQVLDTIPFASGSLQVVEVHNRRLLLSIHSMGVSCLADLTPGNTNPREGDSHPAFFEMVDSLSSQSEDNLKERAINTEPPAPTRLQRAYGVTYASTPDPVATRRARIARLTGDSA